MVGNPACAFPKVTLVFGLGADTGKSGVTAKPVYKFRVVRSKILQRKSHVK